MDAKKTKPLRTIDASFNVFDSGWKKFGNRRKYIKENVHRIINGDIVQERVERGVMLGFFGHRSNAPLDPVENVDNLPSHVTTRLKFYKASGDVEHRQEIKDTRPGQAVLSLHDSNIGNFSWRGKARSNGIMSDNNQFDDEAERHLRFDYVYVPGMVKQPKRDVFLSEGVEDSEELKEVLERCLDAGLTKEEAFGMIDDWQRRGLWLEESTQSGDIMSMELHLIQKDLADRLERDKKRREIVEEAIKSSPYALKQETIKFLSGERDFADKGEVLEAVNNMFAYRDADLGGGFPGKSSTQTNLPESLFFKPGGSSEFNVNNTMLGAWVSQPSREKK